MSYPNVAFPELMGFDFKMSILCPTVLKYIMHIQDSFKKPEFKDFPLLINASDNRYCLSGFVCPPAGLCLNRFRKRRRFVSFVFEIAFDCNDTTCFGRTSLLFDGFINLSIIDCVP